jgi:hypothetical protein
LPWFSVGFSGKKEQQSTIPYLEKPSWPLNVVTSQG